MKYKEYLAPLKVMPLPPHESMHKLSPEWLVSGPERRLCQMISVQNSLYPMVAPELTPQYEQTVSDPVETVVSYPGKTVASALENSVDFVPDKTAASDFHYP